MLLTEFVKLWPTFGSFADAVGVPYATAGAWIQRNSIPKQHLRDVVMAAKASGISITVDDILEMEDASARAASRGKFQSAQEVRAA